MKTIYFTLIIALATLNYSQLHAQANAPIPEGGSKRYIRIAEEGQLTDTVNVWGDAGSQGRYIIPEGTRLPELVSFSLGFRPVRGRENDLSWSKKEIKVKVSRFNPSQKKVRVALFKYRYDKPEPVSMFEFPLQNNDIITLQVQKKPSFGDYLKVIAPVVGIVASSVLLYTKLN